jgi:hypothetical protein
MRRSIRWVALSLLPWWLALPAYAQSLPEYRIKAAILYNFALFTEWPKATGNLLNLCVYGADPFGEELDALQGKRVGERLLSVRRTVLGESLADCQIVFIPPSSMRRVASVIEAVHGRAALTVADSPGAAGRGVALNMTVAESKVSFEANLPAARSAGVNLSSKLLGLATQVIQ